MNWSSIIDKLEVIGTAFGAAIFTGYVAYKTFNSKLEEWSRNEKGNVSKNITKQSKLDEQILREAEKLKELSGADRIHVHEFHNGVHYANGRSALKTSCTYEVCRYGISPCSNLFSDIPLSVISKFINSLLDEGELFVKNIEEIKELMPSTYSLKKSIGVMSFYDVVIYNDKNEPVGFVGVQFCGENKKKIDKDSIKKFAWFVESKLSEM